MLSNDRHFYVPKVFPEISSARVLSSEFVEGLTINEVSQLDDETRNKVSPLLFSVYDGFRGMIFFLLIMNLVLTLVDLYSSSPPSHLLFFS